MLDIFFGPWGWIVAGLLLVGVEVLAPGAFMIWLGLAALLTGLASFVITMSGEAAALTFAALAIACVAVGRNLTRERDRSPKRAEQVINDRGSALVGRRFVLDEPLREGRGRVRVDDSVWRIEGPDLPAGAEIEVIGVEGTLLKVRRA